MFLASNIKENRDENEIDYFITKYKSKIFDKDSMNIIFSDNYIRLKGNAEYGINGNGRLTCDRAGAFHNFLSYKETSYHKRGMLTLQLACLSFIFYRLSLMDSSKQLFALMSSSKKLFSFVVLFFNFARSLVSIAESVSLFFMESTGHMDVNFLNYITKDTFFLSNDSSKTSKTQKTSYKIYSAIRKALPISLTDIEINRNELILENQIKTGKNLGVIYADYYLTNILKSYLIKDNYALFKAIQKNKKSKDFIINNLNVYFSEILLKTISDGLFSAYILKKYCYKDFFEKFNNNIDNQMLKLLTCSYADHKISVLQVVGFKTGFYDAGVVNLISKYAGFSINSDLKKKYNNKICIEAEVEDDDFDMKNPDNLSKFLALYCASGVAGEPEFELNVCIYNNLFKHDYLKYNVWDFILYDNFSLKDFILESGTNNMIDLMISSVNIISGDSNYNSRDVVALFLDLLPQANPLTHNNQL